jgi:hypothetical protein
LTPGGDSLSPIFSLLPSEKKGFFEEKRVDRRGLVINTVCCQGGAELGRKKDWTLKKALDRIK